MVRNCRTRRPDRPPRRRFMPVDARRSISSRTPPARLGFESVTPGPDGRSMWRGQGAPGVSGKDQLARDERCTLSEKTRRVRSTSDRRHPPHCPPVSLSPGAGRLHPPASSSERLQETRRFAEQEAHRIAVAVERALVGGYARSGCRGDVPERGAVDLAQSAQPGDSRPRSKSAPVPHRAYSSTDRTSRTPRPGGQSDRFIDWGLTREHVASMMRETGPVAPRAVSCNLHNSPRRMKAPTSRMAVLGTSPPTRQAWRSRSRSTWARDPRRRCQRMPFGVRSSRA